MAQNTFVPTVLRNSNSYGWATRSGPNSNDIPLVSGTARDSEALKQIGYEWLNWGDGSTSGNSNPPFAVAGKSQPGLTNTDGSTPRVLRGYIRRAESSPSDPLSKCRLYFMYNPPQITRDYASYLDQGALDPFNTVFQSGNLVAPPSFMDFSFELFFDRQQEAMRADHPGVFVDLEYFDMVVRNVVPTQSSTNGALPDNGVMMVNPRDITVVFSEQITVQGRPLNSSVTYEKFTHRMVPTRMRIRLTMRVIYFGPIREQGTFTPEEVSAKGRITFPLAAPKEVTLKFKAVKWDAAVDEENSGDYKKTALDLGGGGGGGGGAGDSPNVDPASQQGSKAAASAAQYASQYVGKTVYDAGGGARQDLWGHADCSSFVWGGFAATGTAGQLGWPSSLPAKGHVPATYGMLDYFRKSSANCLRLYGFDSHVNDYGAAFKKIMSLCQQGDLLFRENHPQHEGNKNHVAYFWGRSGGSFIILHCMSHHSDSSKDTGYSTVGPGDKCQYNMGVRPLPGGQQYSK